MPLRPLNPSDYGLQSQTWSLSTRGLDVYGQCTLCDNGTNKTRPIRHCKDHEQTQEHRRNLRRQQQRESSLYDTLSEPTSTPLGDRETQAEDELEKWMLDRGTIGLLASIHNRYSPGPSAHDYLAEQEMFGLHHEGSLPHDLPEPVADGIADFTRSLMNLSQPDEQLSDSDTDSPPESSDSESEPDAGMYNPFEGDDMDFNPFPDLGPEDPEHSRKRQRMNYSDGPSMNEWYPWPDRITCTLDILMHLPRSVFSERQLELFLWLLTINGVNDVPSVYQMKTINQKLQQWMGIETIKKISPFGNVYFQNKFSQIVAQEMANPQVRPGLSTLPEDAGKHVSEARHGKRWREEIPPEFATPMVRIGSKDYYTFEPTVLWNHPEAHYCIPICWFTRSGDTMAECYKLHPSANGWLVLPEIIEVHETQLLMNFVDFCQNHGRDGVPDPRVIHGVWNPHTGIVSPWNYPTSGNPWRERASGKRVLSLPIWLYCDDTSGNISKKWNKHNSFLFTLAGLDRSEGQKEYNVHFLCTSNIAGPLEMLDGVAEQIDKAQAEGIEAWDCLYGEDILVIPWVLALLGDNPMQSEFACHIGLAGKLFCRVCKVKGKDSTSNDSPSAVPTPSSRPATPDPMSRPATPAPGAPTEKAPRKKIVETFSQVKTRLTDFVSIGELRSKLDSRQTLRQIFDAVAQGGSATQFTKDNRAAGLKDGFFNHYMKKIFDKAGRMRDNRRLEVVRSCIAQFPDDITSPVWRLK
ncbi:hypothetical protein AAF712_014941, partial [Marasmius tenuissimus]